MPLCSCVAHLSWRSLLYLFMERADVIVASANPERAWKELSVSSPEVVARISQAKREFATYQRRDGVFSRPRGGHPTADGMS